MTLGEFRKAVADEREMVVTVFQHKTLETHGPVNVVLTETIHKWMKIFVASMRHRIPGVSPRDDSNLFLTWSGKDMSSSMVSSQINSCWQKAMGKQSDRINAASFRKASVTIVHDKHPKLKKDLADLMAHNPETANKFYNIRQKGKKAAETSRQLSCIMRESNVEGSTETTEANVNDEESSKAARHKWEAKELEAIKCIFAENIQSGSITIHEVREKVHETILEGLSLEKVRDKIRDEIKANQLSQVEESVELPTDNESLEKKVERMDEDERKTLSLFTSGTKSSQLSSRVFTEEQTQVMYEVFSDLIFSNASIGSKEVQRRIKDHPHANKTMVGFTPLQLCSKIRTERQRMGRQAANK